MAHTDLRVDHVVTSGIFALDGGEWEVDNNIWLVGDESEVYIIDAAHSAAPIIEAVGERTVRGIICTHAHNDHINVAPELAEHFDAPILLHPGDHMLWEETLPQVSHHDLSDGQVFEVAGTQMKVLNTPGHSPGSCCLYLPEAAELFSGDTLFQGGPGATGRSYSSFGTIIDSLKTSLLDLPAETTVRTGHGDHTTIGAEAPHLEEWIKRGY
ncbi:MBL fold metallo-hydrolase [Corynebacterium lowii]|uniref:Putative metallo-hydrolase n=1 Tax=Corynebacterium lowii TaxID=1544413 RepID=A0A0Q0ULK7_9CORY|nr:MBL fold metallo-hydrolase [Corynebacterium lowii]KQB87254.1 putative metallo-hydrolase [Corynebacterium lowii]MDP9852159.1 glyoxylase-like metal-dependent hydrolase (beta-lactamase superfamily II) [Corynebacterium lowii]